MYSSRSTQSHVVETVNPKRVYNIIKYKCTIRHDLAHLYSNTNTQKTTDHEWFTTCSYPLANYDLSLNIQKVKCP